jgi:hypothetical protein
LIDGLGVGSGTVLGVQVPFFMTAGEFNLEENFSVDTFSKSLSAFGVCVGVPLQTSSITYSLL